MTEHSAETVELKPCPNPWCEDNRVMVIWDLCSRRVICTCGVKGPRSATKANTTMGVPINDDNRYIAEREAREAWNTRPAMPQQEVTVKDAAKVLLAPDSKGFRTEVYDACEGVCKVHRFDRVLFALSGQDAEGET